MRMASKTYLISLDLLDPTLDLDGLKEFIKTSSVFELSGTTHPRRVSCGQRPRRRGRPQGRPALYQRGPSAGNRDEPSQLGRMAI